MPALNPNGESGAVNSWPVYKYNPPPRCSICIVQQYIPVPLFRHRHEAGYIQSRHSPRAVPATMSAKNYADLCATRYTTALAAFLSDSDDVDVDPIKDVCLSLVKNFECPRLTQIKTQQLFSLCTHDYDEAKSCSEGSLNKINAL